ncbi:hypothetical protein FLAN108750_05430 [Flavobacterium antarcticum]|uniref:hypothetical protein n=2 Tax=Flavobacterium antarcticum TaxID=271155 RepID=UPI0003FC38CE
MIRKSTIYVMISVAFLASCSTKKTIVIDYYSEKLCGGITEISNYIENSDEIKNYFKESNSENTKLNYEVTELVKEGICFPFLQSEVAKIIENKEKISLEQASRRLEIKFLSKPILTLNSRCLEKRKIIKPDVKIEYYYYPEYSLLTAEITKIKYSAEYGKGYLILAEITADNKIEFLKTTFWEE